MKVVVAVLVLVAILFTRGLAGRSDAESSLGLPTLPCQANHSDLYCAVSWHQKTIRHTHRVSVNLALTQYGYIDTPSSPVITWRIAQLRRQLMSVRSLKREITAFVTRPWSTKIPRWDSWICIHRGEGAWSSNTGNGYYGGLQMDRSFMRTYGFDMLSKYNGTANRWTPLEQIIVAERAWITRGFYPWPNTARYCGLI